MAAKAGITEQEYMRTSFPDREPEFRDGEIVERSMPDWYHSVAQATLASFFWNRRSSHRLSVGSELRVKLRAGRHVIADVCVFWPEQPAGTVPDRCPLIVIEILSVDDSLSEVRDKLREYAEWGVPHIWLVDPRQKVLYNFANGLHEVTSYSVPELSLDVQPADIFETAN